MSDIELFIQCQKCFCVSGDAWIQCNGVCPMVGSPHYSDAAALQYGPPKRLTADEVHTFYVDPPDEDYIRDPDDIPY